jgi:hypothetical protein
VSHFFTSEEVISILIDPIRTEEQAVQFGQVLQQTLGNKISGFDSSETETPLLSRQNPLEKHAFFSKMLSFNELKLDLSKIDFLEIWLNVRAGLECIENPALKAFFQEMDEHFYRYREDLDLEVSYPLDYYSALTSELADPKPGLAGLIQKISVHFRGTDPIEGAKFDYLHSRAPDRSQQLKKRVAELIGSIQDCLTVKKNIQTLHLKFEALENDEDRSNIRGFFNRTLDQFESFQSLRAREYRSVLKFYLDFFAEHPSRADKYIFTKISETLPSRNPFIALSTLAQTVYFPDEEVEAQVDVVLRKFNCVDAEGQELILQAIQEFMRNFENNSTDQTEGRSFKIYKKLEEYVRETHETEVTPSPASLSVKSGFSSEPCLTRTDESTPASESLTHPLLKRALDIKRPSEQWALATRTLLLDRSADSETRMDSRKGPELK